MNPNSMLVDAEHNTLFISHEYYFNVLLFVVNPEEF